MQAGDRREIYHYDRGRLTTRTVEHTQDPEGKTYTYRYDAQGNTLGDGENTYLYHCLNRIAEVQTKAGDIQKNHYDAEGLRSQMEENGKLVSFVYADREVITEEDEAGAHIRYIRGHELLASDSAHARTYYHYACDEMGSITDITDCDGTVLNHYAYDAFGNRTVEEETVENRLGFAGEMLDAVTGQYYLRARFYNPVRYVDPSGHIKKICSKKYAELKQKEAEGGKLSLKEKYQIYEYEHRKKQPNGAGSDSKGGSNEKTKYYQVTSNENAQILVNSDSPALKGREFQQVYAWTVQPTLKQAQNSGARYLDTVIEFETSATFSKDRSMDDRSLWDIARISDRPGPISIENVKIVGFKGKKKWWKFWKK